jgi:hypothetical protein
MQQRLEIETKKNVKAQELAAKEAKQREKHERVIQRLEY